MPNRTRTWLIAVLVVAWGANGIVFMVDPHYQGFGQFSAGAATVVGSLMATYRREEQQDDEE